MKKLELTNERLLNLCSVCMYWGGHIATEEASTTKWTTFKEVTKYIVQLDLYTEEEVAVVKNASQQGKMCRESITRRSVEIKGGKNSTSQQSVKNPLFRMQTSASGHGIVAEIRKEGGATSGRLFIERPVALEPEGVRRAQGLERSPEYAVLRDAFLVIQKAKDAQSAHLVCSE